MKNFSSKFLDQYGLAHLWDNIEKHITSIQQIYSTEEVRIGTWIDGKHLYRKVFDNLHTGSESGKATVIGSVSTYSPDVIVNVSGRMVIDTGSQVSIPHFYSATNYCTVYLRANFDITEIHQGNSNTNRPIQIYVTYTKTTD